MNFFAREIVFGNMQRESSDQMVRSSARTNMSARQVSSIAAAILAGCLIGGSVLGQRTEAQPPAAQPVGRYQLSIAGGAAGIPYVIDTATGQVWRHVPGTKWQEFGSPTDKPTDKPKAKD
jgi:hypothetical protein